MSRPRIVFGAVWKMRRESDRFFCALTSSRFSISLPWCLQFTATWGEDLRGFQKQHGAVFCGGDIDEHRFIRHTGIGLCKDLPGTDFIENTAVAENVVAFNRHAAREHDAERVCVLARVADEIALFIAARFRF